MCCNHKLCTTPSEPQSCKDTAAEKCGDNVRGMLSSQFITLARPASFSSHHFITHIHINIQLEKFMRQLIHSRDTIIIRSLDCAVLILKHFLCIQHGDVIQNDVRGKPKAVAMANAYRLHNNVILTLLCTRFTTKLSIGTRALFAVQVTCKSDK